MGLPYNAFLIDGSFLCEAPPDIMLSLSRNKCEIQRIHTIFVSHFHADHFFGIPFLVLNAFVHGNVGFDIIGPKPLKDTLIKITKEAFGKNHPCANWLEQKCAFFEISSGSIYNLSSQEKVSFYQLEHFAETYGFLLVRNVIPIFAYIADTLWCESMKRILEQVPLYALLDLNGEPSDQHQVHFSESDLLQYALPITQGNTRYIGTHLKQDKKSRIDQLEYAVPGMKIEISAGNFD
ncbi:Ribonuclease BN [subsurface metagenome]